MHRAHLRLAVTLPLFILVSGLPSALGAQTELPLQHLLETEIAREVAMRADDPFGSQSTRKIANMIMAFQLADQGKLDLDKRILVGRDAYHTGSGVLQYHDPGALLTLRDLVTEMIITSDNAA